MRLKRTTVVCTACDGSGRRTVVLGADLRALRRHGGLTQTVVADALGVSESYISAVENGKKTPSETLVMFYESLGD